MIKKIFRLIVLLGGCLSFCAVPADGEDIVITIDAGHGGEDSGATEEYDGKTICEKELNLVIAKTIEEELLTYDGIQVYLTRYDDRTLELEQRVSIAVDNNSDLLLSVHNNAVGDAQDYTFGASTLVSSGQCLPELADCEANIGNLILEHLQADLGITSQGLNKRLSTSYLYSNGAIADYYGLIRYGTNEEIQTLIVEHSFLDDSNDYRQFLSSEDKLKDIGKADATAIAAYYRLTKDKPESTAEREKDSEPISTQRYITEELIRNVTEEQKGCENTEKSVEFFKEIKRSVEQILQLFW